MPKDLETILRRRNMLDKLTDDINELDIKSSIDIKLDDINDYYSIQNFIRRSKSCLNKDVGVLLDRENLKLKIVPRRMRERRVKEPKHECVRRYILSERL